MNFGGWYLVGESRLQCTLRVTVVGGHGTRAVNRGEISTKCTKIKNENECNVGYPWQLSVYAGKVPHDRILQDSDLTAVIVLEGERMRLEHHHRSSGTEY